MKYLKDFCMMAWVGNPLEPVLFRGIDLEFRKGCKRPKLILPRALDDKRNKLHAIEGQGI